MFPEILTINEYLIPVPGNGGDVIADLILRHYTFFISDAYFSGWCVSACMQESQGEMMNDEDCCL